jgi:gliding motility-associated-like protein
MPTFGRAIDTAKGAAAKGATTSELPSTVVTTHLDLVDPDDGEISLREAMLYAMDDPTLGGLITFNIPATLPLTIVLNAPLPTLNGDTLSIDGLNLGSDGGRVCLSGDDQYQLFRLESQSSLTLSHLELVHGLASDGMGGAIYCQGAALTVDHCRLAYNRVLVANATTATSCYGGAIYASGNVDLSLQNTLLDSNMALVAEGACVGSYSYGGAIALSQAAHVALTNCRLEGNEAAYGGSIFAQASGSASGSTLHIGRCCFWGNSASVHGGAMKTTSVQYWVHGCTFGGNMATMGGALHLGGSLYRTPSVTSCTFVSNGSLSSYGGSAIRVDGQQTALQLCNNLFVRSTPLSLARDVDAPGNTTLQSWGDIISVTNLPATHIFPLGLPNVIDASAQLGASAIDTVVEGVLHSVYPPVAESAAATLGAAVGLVVGTQSATAHWVPSGSAGSWVNNTAGITLTSSVAVDSLDELGNHRSPLGGAQSVGAIQWQHHQFDTVVLCHESSYTHLGQLYTLSGDYVDTLYTPTALTIVHLHLVLQADRDSLWVVEACDSLLWYGTTYTSSTNTATHIFPNATTLGCDSIARLHLVLHQSTHNSLSATACDSYSWHENTYTASGLYEYDYTNLEGCPSTDTLHLVVNPSDATTEALVACDSLAWNGTTYYATTNIPTYSTVNQAGCDSTVTLNLTVLHGTHTSQTATACESYAWHGEDYTSSGVYTYDYTNSDGCPSTDTLHLTISNHTDMAYHVTACDSFLWNGTTYNLSGTYTYDYSQPGSSCTNVDTLYLTLHYGTHNSQTATSCDFYSWHGNDYSSSGVYVYDYMNTEGCPSTDTLLLILNQGTHYDTTVSSIENYTWHGTTYTTSGDYTYNYVNASGCASADTLHLTILHSSHLAIYDTACDSYLWHDSVYTMSGIYLYHYNNSNEVPSCDTLHLTIYRSSYTPLEVSACDTFYWTAKALGYNTSTTDTLNLFTSDGCDSMLVLHLSIYSSYRTIGEVHACDSFRWDQNGQMYLASAIDSIRYVGLGGCDSLSVLSLVVDYSYQSLLDTTACGSFYWEVTDSLYRQGGYRLVRMVSTTGCDSVMALHLTLHTVDTTRLYDSLCRGGSMWWHGQLCDQEAVYRFDSVGVYGCDSLVYLYLSVVEPPSVTAYYTYDCPLQCYHLTATSSAPYIEWFAHPADSAGLLSTPPDAIARPLTTAYYIVRADWRDTLFCPAYDTLALQPAQLPTATITTRPEMLTEDNLTLYAECRSRNASRLQWMVNHRWYAEDCANITFVASPEDDSVLLEVVVRNDLCVDTVSHTVPIHHEVLYVPNVFLPEGEDASQRWFVVRSEVVVEIEITIFNRKGIPVFHTTDIHTPWDGTYQGVPCPEGAYLYHLRYRVPTVPDNWKSRIGTVTLIR